MVALNWQEIGKRILRSRSATWRTAPKWPSLHPVGLVSCQNFLGVREQMVCGQQWVSSDMHPLTRTEPRSFCFWLEMEYICCCLILISWACSSLWPTLSMPSCCPSPSFHWLVMILITGHAPPSSLWW